MTRAVDAATAWHGRLAGRGALRGRLADRRADHPHGLRGVAQHHRSQCQRHHVRAQARCARELVRGGGGSFVGISSIASSNTHRWFGAYGVTKAALDHMMMLAADELGPSWVRVNSIRPGLGFAPISSTRA